MFIVLAGLPGTGKSTIARALAAELEAVWLRVDSIEQAMRGADVVGDDLKDLGYRAAYAIAEDNLRLGRTVIGDSVNPWMLTRNAWRDAGLRAGVCVVEIETICSDLQEHRKRIETRRSEVPGLVLPNWQAVIDRDYHAWDREHLEIDTAGSSVEACIERVCAALSVNRSIRERNTLERRFRTSQSD
jgi:predicted kinase